MKPWIAIACLFTTCFGSAHAGEELNIVSFGDSTTAPRNVGASRNDRPTDRLSSKGLNDAGNTVTMVDHHDAYLYVYSDVLRDELPNHLTNGQILVYNEGIGGSRTDHALARLNGDIRGKNPDLVIIQFGINDSAHDSGPGTPSRVPLNRAEQYGPDGLPGGGDDHPNAARGNYESNLTDIVTTLRGDGCDVVLMTPNRITDYSVVTESRLTLYAERMRDVASVQGLSLVDVWQGYTDIMAGGWTRTSLLLDGVHPNGDGQHLAASLLIPTLREATGLYPARTVAPTDLHRGVSLDQRLAWTAGTGTLSHDVFLGTDPAPPFVTNQITTTYDPGGLQPRTTYYWRINEITATHTVTGQIWRFTTVSGSVPAIERPTDLRGCRLWLEADDIDADGAAHADGAPVDEWHDKSGSGYYLRYASSQQGLSPRHVTNDLPVLNGHSVVRFNGSNYCCMLAYNDLQMPQSVYRCLHDGTGSTLFLLYRQETPAGAGTRFLVDTGATSSSRVGYSMAYDNRLYSDAMYFAIVNGADAVVTTYRNGSYVNTLPTDGYLSLCTTFETNGAADAVNVYVGDTNVLQTGISASPSTADSSGRFYLAGSNSNESTFEGDIAEVILYSRVLEETERSAIHNYLNFKYFNILTPSVGTVFLVR